MDDHVRHCINIHHDIISPGTTMNNKLTIFCFIILAILLLWTGCHWEKSHQEPCNPNIIKGKSDTVFVRLPSKETVLTKFKTITIIKTDTIYHNLVTMDSAQCNEVKSTELRSTDSTVTVALVFRGELLRSKIIQSEFTRFITTHDTIYKHDKKWDILVGGFVTKTTAISGGAMLGLRIKNVTVGVTVDPFANRTGAYFTFGLR